MSGFDADWLDLREPADHAARSQDVLDAVAAAFEGRVGLAVADLGAGSGSTLRALAPRLGPAQSWTLFDHDPELLRHARVRLAAWADLAENRDDSLVLLREGRRIQVRFALADLAAEPVPEEGAFDLVACSALLDLVGESWMARLLERLRASETPFYAALTYDGAKSFAPPHPDDAAALGAFNRHQRTDKGFGPALGGEAGARFRALAAAAGFREAAGDSPWRLAEDDAPLIHALADGVAQAAEAASGASFAAWRAFRAEAAAAAAVGHVDLFVTPPGWPGPSSSAPARRPS
ncbi:class I SAM-dependent methyltransferase [Methylopila turkensis]|uniref:Methyltransferase domain-containing protein n=1 Tax=Methylopila turkensis TaxID=1437816 RepID=A0A9W6JPY0_9HYPH|nr:class I SAM-dependent methyltransferase [Methylopila turkensis]GLK80391.1 hypothetical protein GCM10008174_21320 [Methylopila turkensis]